MPTMKYIQEDHPNYFTRDDAAIDFEGMRNRGGREVNNMSNTEVYGVAGTELAPTSTASCG